MRVQSEEIPQADILIDVIKTVIAVSEGYTTFQKISHYIDKVERQGRYYRKAAEIIGFIKNFRNNSYLTPLGEKFLKSDPTLNNPLLLQGVLNSRIFQRIIPYLEFKKNISRNNFVKFLYTVADLGGKSMAPRRISSVINWLKDLNIVSQKKNIYHFENNLLIQKILTLDYNNIDEPLLPPSFSLNEYNIVEERTKNAKLSLISYRKNADIDRADNAHRKLVNITSKRIRNAGGIPKYNQFIDLATHFQNQDYIFEMKSLTNKNEKNQLRNALSQLYEYRYLQNKPNAKLILVVEKPLSKKELWRHEYLENDRGIFLIWNGKNDLCSHNRTCNELEFLNLKPYCY